MQIRSRPCFPSSDSLHRIAGAAASGLPYEKGVTGLQPLWAESAAQLSALPERFAMRSPPNP
jgi:hypothetical protein